MFYIRSHPPAVANGDAEDQAKVDNERDVSSKQSTQLCSAGGANSHKANSKPEEQPLVSLTDVKSTKLSI